MLQAALQLSCSGEWLKQQSEFFILTVLQETAVYFYLHSSLFASLSTFPSYPGAICVSELVLVIGSCLLVRLLLVLRLLLCKILLLDQSVSTSYTLTAHKFLLYYVYICLIQFRLLI